MRDWIFWTIVGGNFVVLLMILRIANAIYSQLMYMATATLRPPLPTIDE